jgi:hypothetical protein
MATVNITKHLIIALTPYEQGLILKGLGELPAKDSLDTMNRIIAMVGVNETPAAAVPGEQSGPLKPVSTLADAPAPDPDAAPNA